MKRKMFGLLLLLLVFGGATVWASTEFIYTLAHFNVDSVVSLTLELPGQTGVNSTVGGAATTDIEFNSSTGTSVAQAQVVGGTVQSDGVPIFHFINTGTVPVNISIGLNSSLPHGCITVKAGNTYATRQNMSLNTTGNWTSALNLAAAGTNDVYMVANFTSCAGLSGTSYVRSYATG